MAITPDQTIEAEDFINESERDGTPSNDAGRVPKLENDGKLSGAHTRDVVVLIYTSNDTWTKSTGLKSIEVEVQSAGGNGGGGAGNSNDRGSGGGEGAYAKKRINAADLGATETVTVGAVGNASSFGSHVSCNPGSNGVNATSGIILGGDGGTSTGGDINAPGSKGWNALTYDGTVYVSGRGADSRFGVGGIERTNAGAGNAGSGYGSGGGGGWGTSGNPVAAGAGTPGIIIVTEHYI